MSFVSPGSFESGKALILRVYCLAMPTDEFARLSSTDMPSKTYTKACQQMQDFSTGGTINLLVFDLGFCSECPIS